MDYSVAAFDVINCCLVIFIPVICAVPFFALLDKLFCFVRPKGVK
jgi:hypothetical protein